MVCRATGYPEPYVMWRREDGQEFNCNGESGNKYMTSLSDDAYSRKMKLTIKRVSARDFSSYRCVAKNSLGETDGLIRLDGDN
ncbi:unnamed protein product [Leptidea sinapis]|uniref:Ig-like domain-containing protein n=1 Tax=Leptidea sinapis TaxID=189913 RepID=A0A5E4PQ30_9NEOP|nr:unnamed protein product [Leptidea sinapis]